MAFEDIGWQLILSFENIGANSPEGLKTSNSSGSRGTWGFIGMTTTYFCIYFTCHVTLLFSRILNNTWIDALHLLISLDNLKYFQSLGSKIFFSKILLKYSWVSPYTTVVFHDTPLFLCKINTSKIFNHLKRLFPVFNSGVLQNSMILIVYFVTYSGVKHKCQNLSSSFIGN